MGKKSIDSDIFSHFWTAIFDHIGTCIGYKTDVQWCCFLEHGFMEPCCLVHFWYQWPKLYILNLDTQSKIQILNGLNLSYAAATLFGKIFRHSSTIVSRYFWRTFTGILPAESESITGFLKETTLDTVWAFRVVLPFLNPINKKTLWWKSWMFL